MTSWGLFILVAALFIGLRRGKPTRQLYATAFTLVVTATIYAAVRQHTL